MYHSGIKYLIQLNYPRQMDFAEAAGTYYERVSMALNGRIKIRPDEAEKWATVIGCDVTTLDPITPNTAEHASNSGSNTPPALQMR